MQNTKGRLHFFFNFLMLQCAFRGSLRAWNKKAEPLSALDWTQSYLLLSNAVVCFVRNRYQSNPPAFLCRIDVNIIKTEVERLRKYKLCHNDDISIVYLTNQLANIHSCFKK